MIAELRELVRMIEHERSETRRKRREQAIEEEMNFERPRVPRPLSSRPLQERRAEAEARIRAREAAGR